MDDELDKILSSLPKEDEVEVPPKQPKQEELDTLRKDVQALSTQLEKNKTMLEKLLSENSNLLAHLHLLIMGQQAQYHKVSYLIYFIHLLTFFSFRRDSTQVSRLKPSTR